MAVVLVLGGTSEARDAASALLEHGFDVVSSLAGRVSAPRLPEGSVRIGGFGGVDGLALWLREHHACAVVDATHPFAERIGHSAASACAETGIPLLRLRRPGWQQGPGDLWHWVDSLDEAAATVGTLGERAFVTTGRQGLASFARLEAMWLLIRCVETPNGPLPPHSEVLLSRGPYEPDAERALMLERGIDVLVTKDSGGALTTAKLTAARELGVAVVVVRRPPRPHTDSVESAETAVHWVVENTIREDPP